MAITKVSQYNSTPTEIADYQAQNNYLQALINQSNGSMSILNQASGSSAPYIAVGTYIMMGGTLYVVDTEDYTILGSVVSGSNYIRLTVSGDNLTATWVQNISTYSWSSIYNNYSDGTNVLLPYLVNYTGITYYMSTFDNLNRQSLGTDSSPTFKDLTVTDSLTVENDILVDGVTNSIFELPDIDIGANIITSETAEKQTTETTATGFQVLSLKCPTGGRLTYTIEIRNATGDSSTLTTFLIYINGVSVASSDTTSNVYQSKGGSISFNSGDIISCYLKTNDVHADALCKDLYFKGSRVINAIEQILWQNVI